MPDVLRATNKKSKTMFKTPVVLFLFKRIDKTALIIDRLSTIQPEKLYLIGDGPRNKEEENLVKVCRETAEKHVTWPCQIIKNYADSNRGVFENIAGGAKWVFEREKSAIFLEDDNLPALSFFPFCEEMLHRYEDNPRILWICGSNYLIDYKFQDNASYGFTQNMLPCGWASWADKFNKYYQSDFQLWQDPIVRKKIRKLKYSKALKSQEISNWEYELYRKSKNLKYISWDYQMSFSLRAQNLLGIIPKYNQVQNIGVDIDSIHGGNTMSNEMTSRFCENQIKDLEFPLIHPDKVDIDTKFEKALGRMITYPWTMRFKSFVIKCLKMILGMNKYDSLRATLSKNR